MNVADVTAAPVTKLSQVHPFERANLGKAPFRFERMTTSVYQACVGAPVQPGTSCDYCGTAIMNVFWLKSADGRKFKVGCDCVARINSESNKDSGLSTADRKLLADVARAQAAHERKLRAARDVKKTATLDEVLADEANIAKLSSLPHPLGFTNWKTQEPLTALDYATYMRKACGASGRAKLLKVVTKLLAS